MARLNTLNSPQGFQQLVNFNKGKSLFGSQQPEVTSGREERFEIARQKREEKFNKGVGAFNKLVESLSVDGSINEEDRDKLKFTLERFVRDGLIEGYQARNLYKRYGISAGKVAPNYKRPLKTLGGGSPVGFSTLNKKKR